MGYSTATCLRKVSKLLTVLTGGLYILIQTLSYYGYANVNMGKLEKDFDKYWDMSKSGSPDDNAVQTLYNKVRSKTLPFRFYLRVDCIFTACFNLLF